MNWSEMTASWYEMKALVRSHWPRLADAMLRDINCNRAQLGRALELQYGFSAADAELAICEFEEDVRWPGAVK
jgi:hypothetical protein